MLTFLPIVPTLLTLVVETVGLRDFKRLYGVRVRPRDYVGCCWAHSRTRCSSPRPPSGSPSARSRGINAWEKTEHT